MEEGGRGRVKFDDLVVSIRVAIQCDPKLLRRVEIERSSMDRYELVPNVKP